MLSFLHSDGPRGHRASTSPSLSRASESHRLRHAACWRLPQQAKGARKALSPSPAIGGPGGAIWRSGGAIWRSIVRTTAFRPARSGGFWGTPTSVVCLHTFLSQEENHRGRVRPYDLSHFLPSLNVKFPLCNELLINGWSFTADSKTRYQLIGTPPSDTSWALQISQSCCVQQQIPN